MSENDLTEYLDTLHRAENYRVAAVLKESPAETTQLVYFDSANGAQVGPFVFKKIARDKGLGSAYLRIYQAQHSGRRFVHVPHVIECYEDEEHLNVVMEYVDGETLLSRVNRVGPSLHLACEVADALCDAVTELHEGFDPPLIHRDLKPGNIMLATAGLTVIDFGIAREYKEGAADDTWHYGTRAYAPPEQFGFGQTTVRSDVYALGRILAYCLAGEEALGESGAAVLGGTVSPAVAQVIATATALDPAQRYASARELKAAFLHAAALPNEPERPNQPASSPRTVSSAIEPPRKPNALGTFWNAAVFICVAAICFVSFYDIAHPQADMANEPFWYIAMNYGFVIPVFVIACGILIAYKPSLRKVFPLFRNFKWWTWILAFLVLFLALVMLVAIARIVAGA